ncbi:MAG: hypothetical protein AAF754_20050 [Pseudomonadota bacterium]
MVIWALLIPGSVIGSDTDDHQKDRATRIDLALRQSTVIQSMTQSACFAMGGIDVDRSSNTALLELDTYATVLIGFREGHEWLGLLPETNPDMLFKIRTTNRVWDRYRPAIQQIVAQDRHSVVMDQILTLNAQVIEESNSLARHFLSEFGEEVFSLEMISALHLASHHRMLSQRAMKELCYIRFGLGGSGMRSRLQATLAEFSAAGLALVNGASGVQPPPNARIKRNYRTAALFWSKIQPTFDIVLADKIPGDAELISALKLNASVLKQLNQAVGGYLLQY